MEKASCIFMLLCAPTRFPKDSHRSAKAARHERAATYLSCSHVVAERAVLISLSYKLSIHSVTCNPPR